MVNTGVSVQSLRAAVHDPTCRAYWKSPAYQVVTNGHGRIMVKCGESYHSVADAGSDEFLPGVSPIDFFIVKNLTHTPGPWHIAYGGRDGDDYAVIGSKHADQAICNLEPRGYNPANARLIAAAPELLEACQNLLRHYAPNALTCNDWYLSGNSQTDAILRQARDAIAKAKGAAG